MQVYWCLYRIKRLRSLLTPTPEQVQEMVMLLEETQTKAHQWPTSWPSEWYRQLVQSDSWNAQNVCCTSSLDGYGQDFIHDMVLTSLRGDSFSLVEWLLLRLDARTLRGDVWSELQKTNPLFQRVFLSKLQNIAKLDGQDRAPVLKMLAESEPHFWLYDYCTWYTRLARQWHIAPPEHWWPVLYNGNLHKPPNPLRTIVRRYRGQEITQFYQIMGRPAYSIALLEQNRMRMLSQDPWAIVLSAFYGDTSWWPPRPLHSPPMRAMYADALEILVQYYPQLLTTDFQDKVPDDIRRVTPHLEILMFLGFDSGFEAAQEFSAWLNANNGQLYRSGPAETFSLDNLL